MSVCNNKGSQHDVALTARITALIKQIQSAEEELASLLNEQTESVCDFDTQLPIQSRRMLSLCLAETGTATGESSRSDNRDTAMPRKH